MQPLGFGAWESRVQSAPIHPMTFSDRILLVLQRRAAQSVHSSTQPGPLRLSLNPGRAFRVYCVVVWDFCLSSVVRSRQVGLQGRG